MEVDPPPPFTLGSGSPSSLLEKVLPTPLPGMHWREIPLFQGARPTPSHSPKWGGGYTPPEAHFSALHCRYTAEPMPYVCVCVCVCVNTVMWM